MYIHRSWKIAGFICMMLMTSTLILAQPDSVSSPGSEGPGSLNIPERSEQALGGSEFVKQITCLNAAEREEAVVREVLSGNVPSFSRRIKPLRFLDTLNASTYDIVIYVSCDYLAIGSDLDYFYIPLTPATAQFLADALDCTLPTKTMVDLIYKHAEVKLDPQPIPPSDRMTTIPVFWQHSDSVKQQFSNRELERSAEKIVAGHKKDIILSNIIYDSDKTTERVVIYGWHMDEDKPIQPVYDGHVAWYADYSHGVRFISDAALINGESIRLKELLKESDLSNLLSSEGALEKPYYPGK